MDLRKIGLRHLFLALLIASAFFAIYRHYSYIYSLSPVLRAVYEHRGDLPQKDSVWTLDPGQVVGEFVQLGMTEEEVALFIEKSGLLISANTRRSPSDIKEYEKRIVAYQGIRSGFAGWHALLAGSYTLSISFRFNQGLLKNIDSVLIKNSL